MKRSLVLASLLLVGSVASATDINYFVAAGVGSGHWKVKSDIAGLTSTTVSDNGGSISLDGGVILDNTHRIGLEYAKYNTTGSSSMYSVGLGYDYLFTVNKHFQPFVGLAYTVNKYSEDVANTATVTYDTNTVNLTTKIASARVGADYTFDNNVYVSGVFDYGFSKSGDTTWGLTTGGTHYSVNSSTDAISRFEFLVGYKF